MWYYYLVNQNDPKTRILASCPNYIYCWANDLFSVAVYAQTMIAIEGEDYYINAVSYPNIDEFVNHLIRHRYIGELTHIDELKVLLYEGPQGYQAMTRECIDNMDTDVEILADVVDSYLVEPIVSLSILLDRVLPTEFLMERRLLKLCIDHLKDYLLSDNSDPLVHYNVVGIVNLLYGFDYGGDYITPDMLMSKKFNAHVTILEEGRNQYGRCI